MKLSRDQLNGVTIYGKDAAMRAVKSTRHSEKKVRSWNSQRGGAVSGRRTVSQAGVESRWWYRKEWRLKIASMS